STTNGNVDTCREFGTAYKTTDTCGLTCTSGVCDGETCGQPYDLTQEAQNGATKTASWSDFADDYQSSCGELSGGATDGGDAVFKVNLAPDEVLEATLGGDDTEVGMYVTANCSSTNACLAQVKTDGRDGSLSYKGSSSGETVYLHADGDGNSSGSFTLDVETSQQVCSPDTVLGCSGGDVEYCSSSGIAKKTYGCTSGGGNSGCSSGMCDNRVSEYCFDAEDVTAQATKPSGASRSPDWSNKRNDLAFDACGISASQSSGPDAVYKVDLASDETLKASLEGQLNGPDASVRVLGGCLNAASSCKAGGYDSEEASVRYDATSAETVYVAGDFTSNPGSGNTFEAQVRKRCSTPGETTCANSNRVDHCTGGGIEKPFTCSGCCSSAGGGYDAAGISVPKSGTTRTISVSGCSGTVSKVVAGIDIEGYRHNLEMRLTSPAGTTVHLEENTQDPFED
ncbi:MAG: hypothetical protein ABEN55_11800, partial [Bradymonadaceae bacterium]